jgi:hypothetical protein
MLSISYGADEHYITPAAAGVITAFENLVNVVGSRRRLVNLYAYNSSAAAVFVGVFDTPDGTQASAVRASVYPVGAGSFISIGAHGGERFDKGIMVQAFTDALLTTPAGATIMFWKVDFTAWL